MALEAATYINQLVASNPVGATDPKAQGDDHIRMIKSVLLACFPNVGGEVSASHTTMNTVLGSGISGFAAASNTVKPSGAAAGEATTALRSDVQLVLDTAADWEWTGQHTFDDETIFDGLITLNNRININGDGVSSTGIYLANNVVIRSETTTGSSRHLISLNSDNQYVIGGTSNRVNIDSSQTYITGSILRLLHTTPKLIIEDTDAAADRAKISFQVGSSSFSINALSADESTTNAIMSVSTTGTAVPAVVNFPNGALYYGGVEIGFRDLGRETSALVRGRCRAISSGLTINTSSLEAGATYVLYNNSSSAITLTQGSGVTMRLAGTTTTGSRSIAPRGFATLWCNSATEVIVSGNVS